MSAGPRRAPAPTATVAAPPMPSSPEELAAHVRKRLTACQFRLSDRHPFFGALLMMTPVVVTADVPTAATDGRDVLFNPTFVHGLATAELDALVVHELLHCALLHVPRRRERDRLLWNVAADIHINGIIRQMPDLQLPKGGIEDRTLAHLSVEEIYASLLRSAKPVPALRVQDLLPQPGKGTGEGDAQSPGSGERNDPATEAGLAAHWSSLTARAMAVAEMQRQGSMPAELLRAVRETHQPQVDWRTALWRCLVRTPDDFAGFDRRHLWQGLYLETLEGESVSVDVCIDTSGSVHGKMLDAFLSELRGIVRSYPAVRCRLYYADAACHGPFEVDADTAFPAPKGGGGTDFRPFFAAVAGGPGATDGRVPSHHLAVYLTDGFGTFPKQAPRHDVLWVVAPGGAQDAAFPFGQVVRLRGGD